MFSLFFGRSSILEEDDFDTIDLESTANDSANIVPWAMADLVRCNKMRASTLSEPQIPVYERPQEIQWSPVSTLLLVKQGQLSNIISAMQRQVLSSPRKSPYRSDHWYDALYNKLNAQLWSWHDSLPGELRWNKWSSNLQMVDPSLTSLQYVSDFVRKLSTYDSQYAIPYNHHHVE